MFNDDEWLKELDQLWRALGDDEEVNLEEYLSMGDVIDIE